MQEKLDKLLELKKEADKNQKELNLSFSVAKSPENLENELEIERDGKKVKVAEKQLWVEVYSLGDDSPAGKILAEKYPKPFELGKQADKIQKEIFELISDVFGITGRVSTIDIISIVLQLIDFKNSEKTESVKPQISA